MIQLKVLILDTSVIIQGITPTKLFLSYTTPDVVKEIKEGYTRTKVYHTKQRLMRKEKNGQKKLIH